MKLIQKSQKVEAEHFTVSSMPNDFFGNFGWPSIARVADGTLIVAASGLRTAHVCPFGRSILCRSSDDGRSWTSPHVVNDSPMDDRDMGIISLGGSEILISWFSTDTRNYINKDFALVLDQMEPEHRVLYEAALSGMTDETTRQFQGSWVRYSPDAGRSWHAPARSPVTAPHGPIHLKDGSLLYLGKEFGADFEEFSSGAGRIAACRSDDNGATWKTCGVVPTTPGFERRNEHEPHVVQLPSGKLLGHIRIQYPNTPSLLERTGVRTFSLAQTVSCDGGQSWSEPEPLNFHASPPHLMTHSNGTLICSYGYRNPPRGTRIAISTDEGETWTYDLILRDDATGDNGYPGTVELADGSLYTVQYQQMGVGEKCRLVGSRWHL